MTRSSQTHEGFVRPAAVAGRFYPADPTTLQRRVKEFLAEERAPEGPPPKAIIVPHAGYVYSGPIAASAYVRLLPDRHKIRRVILLGPSHHAEFSGLAVSSADAFATPLGLVPLDKAAVAALRSLPRVQIFDAAHEPEHCLEVHLPFLQVILDHFAIVPLLVGEARDGEVREVLQTLWGGSETRIVISSDLSHYHDYLTARRLDEATARAIEQLRADELDSNNACGCRPICGLIQLARQRGLSVRNVDLRNSGDTAGPRDRVVGYGAFVVTE